MAYLNQFYIISLLFTLSYTAKQSPFEKFTTLCELKDPNLSECVKDAANRLVPQLKNGIREADFQPMDPLYIKHLAMGHEGGAVYLKLELSDTVNRGFSGMKIDNVHIDSNDLKKSHWVFNVSLPWCNIVGDYVGKGRILVLPLGGAGRANFTFLDLKAGLEFRVGKKMVNGVEYLDLKEAKSQFEFTRGKNIIDIKRLKGDLSSADLISQFLKDNADDVLVGIKETLGVVYSDVLYELLRRVFTKVPLKQLFKY